MTPSYITCTAWIPPLLYWQVLNSWILHCTRDHRFEKIQNLHGYNVKNRQKWFCTIFSSSRKQHFLALFMNHIMNLAKPWITWTPLVYWSITRLRCSFSHLVEPNHIAALISFIMLINGYCHPCPIENESWDCNMQNNKRFIAEIVQLISVSQLF